MAIVVNTVKLSE